MLQVLMDPPEFILAPFSMNDAEYDLWRPGIPYTGRVTDELDYYDFSDTCFMPPLYCYGMCSFFSHLLSYIPQFLAPLFMMILKWNIYVRLALFLVLLSNRPRMY